MVPAVSLYNSSTSNGFPTAASALAHESGEARRRRSWGSRQRRSSRRVRFQHTGAAHALTPTSVRQDELQPLPDGGGQPGAGWHEIQLRPLVQELLLQLVVALADEGLRCMAWHMPGGGVGTRGSHVQGLELPRRRRARLRRLRLPQPRQACTARSVRRALKQAPSSPRNIDPPAPRPPGRGLPDRRRSGQPLRGTGSCQWLPGSWLPGSSPGPAARVRV